MLRKIAVAGLCLATAHSAAVDQLQKRDGAGGHHDHGADAGAYGAPPAAYEPPAAEYGAPAPAYEAPADSYGVSYGGYEEETLPDLPYQCRHPRFGWSLPPVNLAPGLVAGGKRKRLADGKLRIIPQHVSMLLLPVYIILHSTANFQTE